MELTEKVAYLKGLLDNSDIDFSSREGKVFGAILDVLQDMALTVSDLEDNVDLLNEQVDVIDEDIAELQEDFYDDDDCDCGCEDDDDDDYEGELYEVTCPNCSASVVVDEDMLDEGEIICPGCKELLEFDLDGILDDCDCGCQDGERNTCDESCDCGRQD